jgi:hypothetical protein
MFFISACQEEVFQLEEPPAEEAFKVDSPVADLLLRTSLNDGSLDNIIDHSSCLTVKLPVTVFANGIELVIETSEDFVEIEKILDASDTDNDVLEILYPIIIILSDYKEKEVESDEELVELAQDCLEDGLDEDIECLDFKYPLSFSIFDIENQLADVVSVNDDMELHKFLENLDEDEFVSLNFPVTMILFDGEEVIVADNNELEELIISVSDSCDEDDDNDFDEDDVDDTELVGFLMEGVWKITDYFNIEDKTVLFEEYLFKYKIEDYLLVSHGDVIIDGEWKTNGDDGVLELELEFDSNASLELISEDWKVIEYGANIIKLKYEGEVDESPHFLNFERVETDQNIYTVSDFIVLGKWLVANFQSNNENMTAQFAGFTMDFTELGEIYVTDGVTETAGKWEESFDVDKHTFALDFDSSTIFKELSNDWIVVELTESRIHLKDGSEFDQPDILVFERIE